MSYLHFLGSFEVYHLIPLDAGVPLIELCKLGV